ncbi:MAG: phosphoenolpyruvate-utilizing N-terminal domain-containing protein, partial [Bacillota bacterium]|nr:phosphoenolpyruvate-utilizing N-terminal domain-containing protein [Bacillota bacterium]
MKKIKGIKGAPGITEGEIVFYKKAKADEGSSKVSIDLESARKKCRDQMQELYEKTLKDLGLDHAKIFAAYDM